METARWGRRWWSNSGYNKEDSWSEFENEETSKPSFINLKKTSKIEGEKLKPKRKDDKAAKDNFPTSKIEYRDSWAQQETEYGGEPRDTRK